MLIAVVMSVTVAGASLSNQTETLRQAYVHKLKHQENLILSARCTYDIEARGTRAEMIPLVTDMCKLQGREKEVPRFIATEGYARSNSFSQRWWRKGIMERYETSPAHDAAQGITITFDGHIMRTVSQNGQSASIDSTEGFFSKVGKNPLTASFFFQDRRLSDLLQSGRELTAKDTRANGQGTLVFSFVHDTAANYGIELTFDSEDRLAERRTLPPPFSHKQPARDVNQIYRISDYRVHPNPAGEERIWFPYQFSMSLCMGTLPDGRIVEWATKFLRVKQIEFNLDIPDSLFTQEIPSSATTWDGLVSQSFLPPGVRPPVVFHPDSRSSSRVVIYIVVILIVVFGFGYIVARYRRKVANAKSTVLSR